MIYVAAGLVMAALVAMASGRVDPLLAILVVLILAAILGIAPVDQVTAGSTTQQVLRRLAFPIGVASALINTTPLVALLISAARPLEQTKRIPAREVLLPIAIATDKGVDPVPSSP
jgi:hypothetical protein